MEKALFLAAFFFAYTVQAVTGFAGNIFAMPVGTTLLGLSPTVSILNAMGFFACGLLAVLNIKHVNWREFGKIIAVIARGDEQVRRSADFVIEVPVIAECLMHIVVSVPLQLLAYYIAVYKGRNVDQPRNLAKSVTVE